MISIIISAYNEEQNILPLYTSLENTLNNTPHEIIFVDDGSTDRTFEALQKLHDKDARVRVIKFRKNFGQTAGWLAGIRAAKGNILVTMDADLQNDPRDIPRLIKELDRYDMVSGWRHNRQDSLLKKLFSHCGLFLRRLILKDPIHDSGCSLKAYKKEALEGIELYGEMHRYIHLLVAAKGFRVGELKVNHHHRHSGRTKYNSKRVIKGFLDLLFVKFWSGYSTRPLHIFGALGLLQLFISAFIIVEQLIKAFLIKELTLGPLLLLGVILIVTGILFIFFGFLGEILIRQYYYTQQPYIIEKELQ